MSPLQKRVNALPDSVLASLNRGIEKESLRVDAQGILSPDGHPAELGSAMTHPHITTDFSEAQLELVTGVHQSIQDTLEQLRQVHGVVHRHIGDELMWSTSMPCRLPTDAQIPIGQYGSSNVGLSKSVYRMGLSYRYGRRMQTISGVHYNFSLPESAWALLSEQDGGQLSEREYRDQAYFALIRNFKRHSWLLLYLFGASPAVCSTFVEDREHVLEPIGSGTMHLPHGTSMRMGPLGYQSDAQSSLSVSYNDLAGYAESLVDALTKPYPAYAEIGIQKDGNYRQLNTSLLQIENEFYGTIRPKRRINTGERPLCALGRRGVEYVEVRCLDIDPFSPIGIAADTAHFVDIFLLHCLLTDSPDDSPESLAIDAQNQLAVAQRGREPGLSLTDANGNTVSFESWATQLIDECAPIAQAMDRANNTAGFSSAIEHAKAAIADASLTPSARVLSEMATKWDNSYQRFALDQSTSHRGHHLADPPSPSVMKDYDVMANESLQTQQEIEHADDIDFETWRQQYIAQDLNCS